MGPKVPGGRSRDLGSWDSGSRVTFPPRPPFLPFRRPLPFPNGWLARLARPLLRAPRISPNYLFLESDRYKTIRISNHGPRTEEALDAHVRTFPLDAGQVAGPLGTKAIGWATQVA